MNRSHWEKGFAWLKLLNRSLCLMEALSRDASVQSPGSMYLFIELFQSQGPQDMDYHANKNKIKHMRNFTIL